MLKAVGRILNIAVVLGFVILGVLLFVIPLATTLLLKFGFNFDQSTRWWLEVFQQAQYPAMLVFVISWVFFVGGCFASFLNVVAWRVPRGKSILGSSRCPQCNIKLKFPQNNVPILGWLRNGGRCANCNLPIPVRYLFAELILGSTFLILFAAMMLTDGATIPFRPLGQFGNILLDPQIDVLVTLGFHLTILSVIFTLAIAATEKFTAPTSIVIFGIVAAIGFHALPFTQGIADFRFGNWENGTRVVDSGQFLKLLSNPKDFGIAVGIGCAAAVLSFLAIRYSGNQKCPGVFASLLLIGICFGWQAVVSITVFFLLISVFLHTDACSRIFLATLVHLCLWRLQTDCQWWPGPASGLQQLLSGLVFVGVLASLQWFMTSRSVAEQQNDLHSTQNDLPRADSTLE